MGCIFLGNHSEVFPFILLMHEVCKPQLLGYFLQISKLRYDNTDGFILTSAFAFQLLVFIFHHAEKFFLCSSYFRIFWQMQKHVFKISSDGVHSILPFR